jgi:hypothetical protein
VLGPFSSTPLTKQAYITTLNCLMPYSIKKAKNQQYRIDLDDLLLDSPSFRFHSVFQYRPLVDGGLH